MTKRTFGGTKIKALRVCGFRSRMQTKKGQKLIQARRARGRKRLSLSFR